MGCPKHFSVSGGMGAALLSKPEVVRDIISTLVRNMGSEVAITAKIRLFPEVKQTLEFMNILVGAGVKAIAVHSRQVPERPRDPARWLEIKQIAELWGDNPVPLIHNGDVFKVEDIERSRKEAGINTIMIARGAIKDPSIFAEDTTKLVPLEESMKQYTRLSVEFHNPINNTKYTLMKMLEETKQGGVTLLGSTQTGKELTTAKSMLDICKIWKLEDCYNKIQEPPQRLTKGERKRQNKRKIEEQSHNNTNSNENDIEDHLEEKVVKKHKTEQQQ